LLRNRLYRGEIPHKGQTYPSQHKAIVSEALFEAVQARLMARPRAARHRATRAMTATPFAPISNGVASTR
ncbi:MAG: recombinase family protein, partial [Methylobacterium sp.]